MSNKTPVSRIYRVVIGRGTCNEHAEYGDTESEAWEKMQAHARLYHQGLAEGILSNAQVNYAKEGSPRWREYANDRQEQDFYADHTA